MKGPKYSFCVSSYLNQWLIVSNLQNQSVTDRQTDGQTDKPNRQTDRMTSITPHKCTRVNNNNSNNN